MDERIPIAFLGWREEAQCLLETWNQEGSPVVVVGVVSPPEEVDRVPLDIVLPRAHEISELEKIGPVSCLVDLRQTGNSEPDDLPGTVAYIPPEGAQLLERLCRQGQTLQRYRKVVETATDAVVTIDESHRVLFFNDAAEAMFGYEKEEIIGKDLGLIIPSPHREVHRDYVRRYVETRAGRFIDHTVELTAERRSGERFPISISFSVTEEAGNLLMTAVMRDMTEMKALLGKAIQNERLASMGQALSVVTHEIKNPLVSIGGFARSLLQNGAIKNDDRKRLDIIVKEVRRLEDLLGEVQDFSKPLIMEREEIHLAAFLQEIMAFFLDNGEWSRVRFSLEVRDDPVVWADPDRLRQVILNLIKNAIDAIENEGRVRLSAWKEDETTTIEIKDNGEGIDDMHMEEIFEPFFTTKKEGSGLGLPLCRKIVREHDGELTIFSEIGRGTSARIILPIHQT